VMAEGMVLQQGRADAIHRAPRNARVADIVGLANRFEGIWEGPDARSPAGTGWLRWGQGQESMRLPVRDKGRIEPGQAVSWVVPGEGLHLCQGEETPASVPASAPPGGLPLRVRLVTLRHLGDVWLLQLACDDDPLATFRLMLTGRQVLPLRTGQELVLCLDLSMVHIMPVRTGTGTGTALPHSAQSR
jgi:molybdate transport system ATP-binding protein